MRGFLMGMPGVWIVKSIIEKSNGVVKEEGTEGYEE